MKVEDNSEMPCEDWKGTIAEIYICPMQKKWHEGETRHCFECGWDISYNCESWKN